MTPMDAHVGDFIPPPSKPLPFSEIENGEVFNGSSVEDDSFHTGLIPGGATGQQGEKHSASRGIKARMY